MKRVIKRIEPLPAAKIAAIIYFIITAVFFVPMAMFSSSDPSGALSSIMPKMTGGPIVLFILPFAEALIGGLIAALLCVIYNSLSAKIGGIEVEVGE